jgi:integrase
MTMQSKTRRGGRRRARGEGSILQRGDGRWVARVTLPDGKRREFYGKTQAEVRSKLIAARADVQAGLPLPNARLTLGAWLKEWLDTVARSSVRASTFRTYEGYVKNRVQSHQAARLPLGRLTPSDLDRLFADLRAAGLSPRTIEQIRAIIRRALNVAMKRGLVARNVATLTDPPRVERKEAPALSPEDARRLLDALADELRYPLYAVALASGRRLGELLGLRWEDVDLDEGIIHVRQAAQRLGRVTQFAPPKTNRSRRQVTLPASTLTLLHEHRARQLAQRLAAGPAWQDVGLVFPNELGAPLVGTSVTNGFQRALARAGLPKIRFHDLRHGTASLLLVEGVNPRVVMERLGHSTIALTLGTYSHVIPALDREAAARLDRALSGRS